MRAGLIAVVLLVAVGVACWLYLRAPVDTGGGPTGTGGTPTTTTGPGTGAPPTGLIAALLAEDAGEADAGPLPTLRGIVRDETGGIAQAAVEIHRRGEAKDRDCSSHLTTSSVAGGSFEVGPLCPGQYDVRATRGLAVATATARLARGVEHEPLLLSLHEGTRLTVRVRDGAKAVLSGADVQVQDTLNGFLTRATSDARGEAVFDGLVPRRYSIWATKPDFIEASLHDRTLAPQEDAVDLTLIAGVRVDGRVLGPDGAPLGDAWVKVGAPRKELRGGFDDAAAIATNDAGEFSVGPVRPGSYVVVASHDFYPKAELPTRAPGPRVTLKLGRGTTIDGTFLDADGAPVTGAEVHTESEDDSRNADSDDFGRFSMQGLSRGAWTFIGVAKSTDGGAQGVALANANLRDEPKVNVTLQLQRGLRIDGRCQNPDGTSADTDVIAVEQALFRRLLLSGFDVSRVPPGSVAISSCSDRFTLEGLKPGRYALLACGNDKDPLIASAGDRDVTVTCREGELVFRVVDGNRRPVEKYAIGSGNSPPEDHPDGRFKGKLWGETDEVLTIRAPGFAPLQRKMTAKRGERLDLGELVLVAARKVSGRVTDARTGKSVAGAEVRFGVNDSEAANRARTRADGAYELGEVAREPGAVFVTHASYRLGTVNLDAVQAQADVALEPGLELSGAVITHDGREVRDFEVEARGPDGTTQSAPVVAGRYTLGSLSPGEWKLRLNGGDVSAFDPLTVTLIGSGTVSSDFVERLSGVNVMVMPLDDEGHPVVALMWLLPGRQPRPSTDADATKLCATAGIGSEGDPSGAHVFNAVTPGPYTVVVRAKQFPGMVWVEPLEVSSSMPSLVRVAMPRGLAALP